MTEAVKYSKGIQMIVDEHAPLREQMAEISARAQELGQQGDSVSVESVENLNTFVRTFVRQVGAHSVAEDLELSPLLGKHLGMDARPIVGNAEQHHEAKHLLDAYWENFQAFQAGDKSRLSGITESLLGAVKVLTEHFDFEEARLFPLAEQTLTDEEKAELLEKLQARKNG
jgi:regulator of cell morphogenesis and NO signaling